MFSYPVIHHGFYAKFLKLLETMPCCDKVLDKTFPMCYIEAFLGVLIYHQYCVTVHIYRNVNSFLLPITHIPPFYPQLCNCLENNYTYASPSC